MTETINIAIDSEDLRHFEESTGMKIAECIEYLINSVKCIGKPELSPFYSDENLAELNKRLSDYANGKKMIRHDIIEVED